MEAGKGSVNLGSIAVNSSSCESSLAASGCVVLGIHPGASMSETSAASRTFDVCIVGAGPAGSTCAFYLARQGVSVVLLDKERFPRDKLCGDAVCSPAHAHLREMGVLQAIEAEG